MTEKKFINILMISIAICISLFILAELYRADYLPEKEVIVTSVKNKIGIDVSKIVYDAKITIPNTSVTVSYPKLGYDGRGVTLGRSREGALMVYEKTGGVYVVSRLNGHSTDTSVGGDPMATIDVYKLNGEKTLDEAVKNMFDSQMPDNQNNHYETINGVRYYFALDPTGVVDTAYTLMNNHLVYIALQTSYKEIMNDLFTQILSNINYSCKGDCSVNANEIIEMGKERFGGSE